MIELSHVYKTYAGPVHALKNIDLKIEKGEFVFLTGPSGAGKTTLFRMISAYDRATSGNLIVGNTEVGRLTADQVPFYRRKIGVVFQDFRLLKDKTVFDNVALPLQIRGDRPQAIKSRVSDVLDMLGLGRKSDQLPEFLSGGEQQRTAIARAIVHQPALLIADEPTGNLDPALSREIMDLFERICAQGTTIFLATHDHSLVKCYSKRQVEIKDGMLSGVGK